MKNRLPIVLTVFPIIKSFGKNHYFTLFSDTSITRKGGWIVGRGRREGGEGREKEGGGGGRGRYGRGGRRGREEGGRRVKGRRGRREGGEGREKEGGGGG